MGPINISKYNDLELALMVMLGYFGNGADRRAALGSRYDGVQDLVEDIVNGTMPASPGSNLDPAKLQKAIDAVFENTLIDLRKEIIEKL